VPWTIYCHTLISDGRRYVGQTSQSMARRWRGHCRYARADGSRTLFANTIRKHGPDAFAHEVLQTCATQEEANEVERIWIERLGALDPAKGFNRKVGGNEGPHDGRRNPWDRPEHRAKMLEALNRPEAIAKMSEASRLAKASPEFRAKVSAEAKARWADPEHRAAHAAAIAAGQRAAREADPEGTARRFAESAAKVSATKAQQRAERTHFDCKVHGPVPLVGGCYSKIAKATGLRVYECKACVLAVQKVKRDEFRAENPIEPFTTHKCKVHGEMAFEDCFKIARPGGRFDYKCKVCNLAAQKAWRERKKAKRQSDPTFTT